MNGAEIKEYREKLAMTQEQFAEALGVARNTIARWERDAATPESPKMLGLAMKQLLLQRNRNYSRESVEKAYREIMENIENTRQILDNLTPAEMNLPNVVN